MTKVTVDLPQSTMRPGSWAEVGREEERDYFWGPRSVSELPEEVMMEANSGVSKPSRNPKQG